MKNGKPQIKDIPDQPILDFIGSWQGEWCFTFTDHDRSVFNAMPAGTPWNLGLAKMRSLIRRKLVNGCGCGCRGDFTIRQGNKE